MLAILALGVIAIPTKVNADRAGRVTPYNSTKFADVSRNSGYNTYQEPENVESNTSTTSNSNSASTVKKSTATTSTTASEESAEDSGNLATNAIFGSNGFMPSGLIQWILIAIFILLIVILVRRITGAENKYHSEPLKHA